MSFITTETVAYFFALVIACVTIFHRDSPHSRALLHEASILKELDAIPPDEYRTELRDSSTAFYEKILKKTGAGGRCVAKPLVSKFEAKTASVPVPAPSTDADCAAEEEHPEAPAPSPPPADAVVAAGSEVTAVRPERLAPPTRPPQREYQGRQGCRPAGGLVLIETCLCLH